MGLLTLYFSSYGLSIDDPGLLNALHPGIWGILQLATGILSDKVGVKILIFPEMFIQSIGIWTVLYSQEFFGWVIGMSFFRFRNCFGVSYYFTCCNQ